MEYDIIIVWSQSITPFYKELPQRFTEVSKKRVANLTKKLSGESEEF
jgi:hypothetical protein